MAEKKRITLDDVARLAGVSAITVSRALRRPEMVSEQVKARIDAAVRELNYMPNPAARMLASGRSDVIGVVIPSVTNNVYADVLRDMYAASENTAYEIQLANTRYSPLIEEKALRVFASQKPAGLVVTGFDQSKESAELLKTFECPIVQIMECGDTPFDASIGFSHIKAAQEAARHLYNQGYRKLSFIGARMDPRTQRRFAGFRQVATEFGCFDDARVVTTLEASSVSRGAELFADLLARAPDADAVFCNNDDLAVGALFEAQRRRISVPGQLGICGFNDLEMMAAAEPPLTSIKTPRADMGRRAIEYIVARLADKDHLESKVDLGFEIVARASTRRQG